MTFDRRFDFRELSGADETGDDADLGQALSAARAIEAALAGPEPVPAPDLADRIMAAVAREPAPRAIGIVAALRRQPGLGGVADSLRVAWDRAFRAGRPIGLRLGGLAYVAVVLVLTLSLSGVAAYTAGSALGLFGPTSSQRPDATQGQPTPGPLVSPEPAATESAEPSESPEPTESTEPSETAEPSGDDGDSTDEPSDDHGGDGDSSESETETPRPTETPTSEADDA